ncbi:3-deoxy-manno-octulosonate cytidylyltransferase [Aliarcobacter thereius]|uniref:3-deoxy-manno-octulosonate cytidylyltransferase n=1 Tax=Aliarcobacter thereius TaxID=544718 RepID=A0A5R9H775_9BACT|nr:3-deoxy-manno-octulosonate cytidylyltransferase [Aliarcobacter thereius]TLS71835.1 3-deoxy-manno-octulosonate cytidylyltransferase [Aliarcobacter thereius]
MKNINILDCTLRDGGYVNNWNFEDKDTLKTIQKLLRANVEIIECGFLDKEKGKDKNCTRFKTMEQLESLVENIVLKDTQMLVAMIEYTKYDIDSLPQVTKNSKVRGIRFSFRKSDFEKALLEMPKIKAKGYELFVQPISTLSYTKDELQNLLQTVNTLNPYAVYVVDTQGSMFADDFKVLYESMDKILDEKIFLGFHSHNNMQLSYSIAISFIEIAQNRNIIIDASVYGMGRGAGNLNTELLADYINKKIDSKYNIEEILELIDSYYYTIYKTQGWGYSLAHFLSASLECHPNYASYLLDTKHLTINEIKYIMAQVPEDEKYEYNKQYIEKLYINFNETKHESIYEPVLGKDKKVLLIGSGKNLSQKIDEIRKNKDEYLIIALNHIPQDIKSDYYFFSSQKRYNEFCDDLEHQKTIVSNNIKSKAKYKIEYKILSHIQNLHSDNSAVMMINYLLQNKFDSVYIAGVDGFSTTQTNYNYNEKDVVIDNTSIEELNSSIQKAIEVLSKSIRIHFITTSLFEVKSKPKVVGVIPARYGSTRLPGKPLADIEGLPMIVHTMKRAMMSDILDEVVVATDDNRIFTIVEKYGGKAIMTDENHVDGICRMQEVSTKFNGDIFVSINGDEPLLNHYDIEKSVHGLINDLDISASMLVIPYTERNNYSNIKVVLNHNSEVLYTSRSDIPSDARVEKQVMWKGYYIVSFTKTFLDKYVYELKDSPLNERESLNENKILEYGYKIKAVKTDTNALSVDTPEDLEIVREMMKKDKLFPLYKDCKID